MTESKTGMTLPIKFGPYYLFDFIGKGGMAEIFLAKTLTELGTEKLCVIKRILPHLNEDEDFCEMLINEAKIVSNLSHANVVKTLQLGKIDRQYYIAMEYVEGVDLNKLLGSLSRAGSSLPLQFALYIIIETLKGLDYAHRAADASGNPYNIIHRDVSPTNVLISNEGEVKLCDFGIAKVAQDEIEAAAPHINEHHLKGKMAYMAPEHIAGDNIDQRADLFTVGILLWELLNGRRLYKSKNQDETFQKAKEAIIPDIVNRGYDEYDMLSVIVKKALSRNVDDRFTNGREFIRAIEDYLHATGQVVSQLRFSEFLMENLGDLLSEQRKKREAQAAQLSETLLADAPTTPENDAQKENKDNEPSAFTLSLLSDEEEPEPESKEDSSQATDRFSTSISTSIADNLAQKFEEEERQSMSPQNNKKSPSSIAKWILIAAALAALAIGGYFAYLKFF
ncbi:MAG: serine/threonine protein kinase [Deltaproteobacteria bacterium]|nr:serine/threonine protein kinase [Deltaproteobacteria bacterium]MBN2672152.1 serine/threonine protein kinase [Deltaproteobacteria bacterium]